MSKEVTLFITSCGRPDLLRRTLTSFVKHNTYTIKEAILCEDSGIPNISDFAVDILPCKTILCYNATRIGQMKTIETYVPLITTDYVFHLEDDFEFFESGFIELSFQILDSDKKVSQVLLHEVQFTFPTVSINNPLCSKVMTSLSGNMEDNYGIGPLSAFSWTPSLKRTEIQKLRMPYQPWDDEYTIQLAVNNLGYYSAVPKKIGRQGFCTHIGWHAHIPTDFRGVKVVGRADFPDKARIRLDQLYNNIL